MSEPPSKFAIDLIERVRRDGGVSIPQEDVAEDDFAAWRRDIRAAAKKADLNISISRTSISSFIHVVHKDHVVTDDERRAGASLLSAAIYGRELSYNDALKDAKRHRMRLIQDAE
jgi:hypothetical protein